MLNVIWNEPQQFAAGDTLAFKRALDAFPAPAWSLLYEARGQAQPIAFVSTADGQNHSIAVDSATTATWLPGDYTLVGYAVAAAPSDERHEIYRSAFTVLPNAQAQAGNEPVQTFAQQMIAALETVMLAKAQGDVLESGLGETRFKYMTMEELRNEHGYWKTVRRMEVAKENAKSGRPTGLSIRPVMNITGPGPSLGGAVWPFGNSQ